jgi:formylglycine-generating enzyme required for sulfatase activity
MRKLGDDNPSISKPNQSKNSTGRNQECEPQAIEELNLAENLLCDRGWERNAYKFFKYPDFHNIKEIDVQNIVEVEIRFLEVLYSQWGASVDLTDRLNELKEALSKAKISLTDPGQKKAYDHRLEALKFQELKGELDGRISVGSDGRNILSIFALDAIKRNYKEQGITDSKGPGSIERLDAYITKEIQKRNAIISTWQEEFKTFIMSKYELGFDIESTRQALKDFLDRLQHMNPSPIPSLEDALDECGISLESPSVQFNKAIIRYLSSNISQKEYGKLIARAKTQFFLEEQEVEKIFEQLRGITIDGDYPQVFYWKRAVEDKKDIGLLDRLMNKVRADYPDNAVAKIFDAIKSVDFENEKHILKIRQNEKKNLYFTVIAALAIGLNSCVAAIYFSLPMPFVMGLISATFSLAIIYLASGILNRRVKGGWDARSVHERTLNFLYSGENLQKLLEKKRHKLRFSVQSLTAFIAGSILFILLVTIQIDSVLVNLFAPQPQNGEIMIPRGFFMMGVNQPAEPEEGSPRHQVSLDYAFIVKQHEVTIEEWTIYNEGILLVKDEDKKKPKSNITIWEAMEFCNFMSRQAKMPEAYTLKTIKGAKTLTGYHPQDGGWRLPSEEEWEYLASKGKLFRGMKYSSLGGSRKVGMNFSSIPVDVSTTPRNLQGVQGLNCNVQEWCLATESSNFSNPLLDQREYISLENCWFVTKGGSYQDTQNFCTNTSRNFQEGNERRNGTGFRMVRTLVE